MASLAASPPFCRTLPVVNPLDLRPNGSAANLAAKLPEVFVPWTRFQISSQISPWLPLVLQTGSQEGR